MSTASRPLTSLGELATTRKTTDGPDVPSKIDVDSMNFYYGEKRALQDISIRIKPNVVTAFIGPSGCGMSTFRRTLNRMIEIIRGSSIEGHILIDNVDMY